MHSDFQRPRFLFAIQQQVLRLHHLAFVLPQMDVTPNNLALTEDIVSLINFHKYKVEFLGGIYFDF